EIPFVQYFSFIANQHASVKACAGLSFVKRVQLPDQLLPFSRAGICKTQLYRRKSIVGRAEYRARLSILFRDGLAGNKKGTKRKKGILKKGLVMTIAQKN